MACKTFKSKYISAKFCYGVQFYICQKHCRVNLKDSKRCTSPDWVTDAVVMKCTGLRKFENVVRQRTLEVVWSHSSHGQWQTCHAVAGRGLEPIICFIKYWMQALSHDISYVFHNYWTSCKLIRYMKITQNVHCCS